MYVCVSVCVCVDVCMCVYACACVCMDVCVCLHVCMHFCVHSTYIRTLHVFVCMYMYHVYTCYCYSDPYVKISFRGPISIFPHFTTISNDPVPDFYKTKTIQKVHHFDVIVCDTLYY